MCLIILETKLHFIINLNKDFVLKTNPPFQRNRKFQYENPNAELTNDKKKFLNVFLQSLVDLFIYGLKIPAYTFSLHMQYLLSVSSVRHLHIFFFVQRSVSSNKEMHTETHINILLCVFSLGRGLICKPISYNKTVYY